MECPQCRNKRFKATDDVPYPIKNLGNKEKYPDMDTRRYICLQCGYMWMTKEVFYRVVEIRRERTLFDKD